MAARVPVAVSCTDRSGDTNTINCDTQAGARVTGNCNSFVDAPFRCSSSASAATPIASHLIRLTTFGGS